MALRSSAGAKKQGLVLHYQHCPYASSPVLACPLSILLPMTPPSATHLIALPAT